MSGPGAGAASVQRVFKNRPVSTSWLPPRANLTPCGMRADPTECAPRPEAEAMAITDRPMDAPMDVPTEARRFGFSLVEYFDGTQISWMWWRASDADTPHFNTRDHALRWMEASLRRGAQFKG